jgi:FAD/FMN-containing dehydrogenase
MMNRSSFNFLLWSLSAWSALVPASESSAWVAFNASIGGRLESATPVGLPCFSFYKGAAVAYDDALCTSVRQQYRTNAFRADKPGSYMYLQGEMCLGNPQDQCLLDSTVNPALAPSSTGVSCNQGNIPDYYLPVRDASDIVSAFNFSRQYGIPLAIRNSGHDMMTRSSQKGALALWVGGLDSLAYHEDFIPDGCTAESSKYDRVVAAGTGADTGTIMSFASQHGSTFIGGYSPTVAASGGWVLGGGHSVLSPVYGLGVDRVVQFTIVTPDGETRTANECVNQDLFWALRGGGGGTFGVVLEAVHRVEPIMPVAVADIRLPSNATLETSVAWIRLMVEESLRWGKEGWGGHAAGLYLTHMNPAPGIANMDDEGAAARASMQRASQFALSVGGTSVIEVLPDYLDVWNKYVVPGAIATAASAPLPASRLLPESLFADKCGISKIMDIITGANELGIDPRSLYVPVDTPYVATASEDAAPGSARQRASDKAVHPAWYGSLWHLTVGIRLRWNATLEDRLRGFSTNAKLTALLEETTGPQGGSYLGETDLFAPNWRQSWWGENYPRLLEIKNKYDPDHVLKCWKCVGFEEEDISSEQYSCNGLIQQRLAEEEI